MFVRVLNTPLLEYLYRHFIDCQLSLEFGIFTSGIIKTQPNIYVELFCKNVNPIQDGHFWDCSRMGGGQKSPPLPKICHAYPTMMKLGIVIPYLKRIQKIYESRDTLPEFCWRQHFFTGNQQILLYYKIQI